MDSYCALRLLLLKGLARDTLPLIDGMIIDPTATAQQPVVLQSTALPTELSKALCEVPLINAHTPTVHNPPLDASYLPRC
uniref:Putative secreted protein n=1 Tax=Anopheles marajoara TaxID=58244 RepID=A0A2M4CBS5_9DIPT